jgi:hypothetical protein
MTNYINKINCFADAEARYRDTKPLVSKNHTLEQDVRPVGDRTRKQERIIKISDTCYALSCGGRADPVFTWGLSVDNHIRAAYPITPAEIARLSPIVWRKLKDGTETITIRNGAGEWQHNHIYSFINRALPRNIGFVQTREGKQFLNTYERSRIHLPKTTSAPRYLVEHWKAEKQKGKMPAWAKAYMNAATAGDDGLSVTFKREESGRFTLVGEPHKVMVDRTYVNKELKASLKKDVTAFLEHVTVLYPLMQAQINWSLRDHTNKELKQIAAELKLDKQVGGLYGNLFQGAEPKLIHRIIKDQEHPMRHSLTLTAMFKIYDAVSGFQMWKHNDTPSEEVEKLRNAHIRSSVNKWINEVCGFNNTIRKEI